LLRIVRALLGFRNFEYPLIAEVKQVKKRFLGRQWKQVIQRRREYSALVFINKIAITTPVISGNVERIQMVIIEINGRLNGKMQSFESGRRIDFDFGGPFVFVSQ